MPSERSTVQIPPKTFKFIKYLVAKYPRLGYGSAAEFCRAAIRKLLKEELDRLGLPSAQPSPKTDPSKVPGMPKLGD